MLEVVRQIWSLRLQTLLTIHLEEKDVSRVCDKVRVKTFSTVQSWVQMNEQMLELTLVLMLLSYSV